MSPLQSPPVSQGDEDMVMFDSPISNPPSGKSGELSLQRPSVINGNSGHRNSSTSAAQTQPGSGWQTKKFQEEYDRSMSQLLDQKWSMSSYPDPLRKRGKDVARKG